MTTLTTPTTAINIENLSYTYPRASRPAVDQLSLTIEHGELFALLGPNGGGKSTLFRILATLLKPDAGRVAIADCPTHTQIRRQLGIVFQHPSIDALLTVWENITVAAAMHGLRGEIVRQRGQHWLEAFDLWDRRTDRAGTLSGGLQRRLEIAKTLLHEPKLLLLDEPTTGLDPVARRQFWQDLATVRSEQDITIVLTTHLLEEADTCDRVAILSAGKLLAVDTPTALTSQIGGEVVTLKLERDALQTQAMDKLLDQLHQRGAPWPPGTEPKQIDDCIRFEHPSGAKAIAEFADLLEQGICEIRVSRPTLEDVFIRLTGRRLE